MATSVKVAALEIDGFDLSDMTEYDLTAETIPFADASFAATNVKDAILEAGMTVGFDCGGAVPVPGPNTTLSLNCGGAA